VIQLLFITTQKARFAGLSASVESRGGNATWADSGHQALETIKQTPADLVVVDEDLGDMRGLAFIRQLVAVNPMINCALVSSLSHEDYHEASEGLGILMQLPPEPSADDGERLMAQLNQILGLASPL